MTAHDVEILAELRSIRGTVETLIAQLQAAGTLRTPAASTLRNVYTPEQFSSEVLCGNRSVEWVQDECRAKRIKTVARRPWLIPAAEALRFTGAQK